MPWGMPSAGPRLRPQKRGTGRSGYPRPVRHGAKIAQPVPPRGLVIGASVWIAVSWLALMGPTPPLQPTSLSYTPAIRMMVQSMLALTVVAWPLVRLSSATRPRPVLSALLDTIAIAVFWQIVLWPMRLVTTWPIGRLAAIDAEAIASCLLVGGMIAWSGATARGRTGAMVALLSWSIVVPALAAGRGLPLALLDGPFVRTWVEASRGPGPLVADVWWPAAITAGIAVVIWTVAATRGTPRAGDSPGTSLS